MRPDHGCSELKRACIISVTALCDVQVLSTCPFVHVSFIVGHPIPYLHADILVSFLSAFIKFLSEKPSAAQHNCVFFNVASSAPPRLYSALSVYHGPAQHYYSNNCRDSWIITAPRGRKLATSTRAHPRFHNGKRLGFDRTCGGNGDIHSSSGSECVCSVLSMVTSSSIPSMLNHTSKQCSLCLPDSELTQCRRTKLP